jgi:hypothetical protein
MMLGVAFVVVHTAAASVGPDVGLLSHPKHTGHEDIDCLSLCPTRSLACSPGATRPIRSRTCASSHTTRPAARSLTATGSSATAVAEFELGDRRYALSAGQCFVVGESLLTRSTAPVGALDDLTDELSLGPWKRGAHPGEGDYNAQLAGRRAGAGTGSFAPAGPASPCRRPVP